MVINTTETVEYTYSVKIIKKLTEQHIEELDKVIKEIHTLFQDELSNQLNLPSKFSLLHGTLCEMHAKGLQLIEFSMKEKETISLVIEMIDYICEMMNEVNNIQMNIEQLEIQSNTKLLIIYKLEYLGRLLKEIIL